MLEKMVTTTITKNCKTCPIRT